MVSQLILPFPAQPGFGIENFVVTPSNEEAFAWMTSWPDWPGNALMLVGEPGSGKTHLSSIWAEASQARWVDASMQGSLQQACEEPGPLVIKHAHITAGEDNLFHLLNSWKADKVPLLLLADIPPLQWTISLPDLRSRILALPVATLHPPDDMLVAALLTKQFADRQIHVSAEVIRYLTTHAERSYKALAHLIERIDAAAMANQRAITLPLARKILTDLQVL